MKAYIVMEVEPAGYESLRRGFGASVKSKYENGSTETEVRKPKYRSEKKSRRTSISWISRFDFWISYTVKTLQLLQPYL